MVRINTTTTTAVRDDMWWGVYAGSTNGCKTGGYDKTLWANVAKLFEDFTVSQNSELRLMWHMLTCFSTVALLHLLLEVLRRLLLVSSEFVTSQISAKGLACTAAAHAIHCDNSTVTQQACRP
jgi:hypothetical protein